MRTLTVTEAKAKLNELVEDAERITSRSPSPGMATPQW